MQLSHCVGVLLLTVPYGLASFCGDSAIPFSFEALPDGQPVLGCSRPACFGWSAAGQPFSDKFSFYTVNGHPDGFFQPLYHAISPFQPGDGIHYPEQFSRCDDTYRSNSCDDSTQWVGGIAPVLNASGYPLVLQCCTYDPLRYSTDRGIATIHTGEIFAGGEVTKNNQTYAFDYISNVERKVDESGRIFYEVNVKRLPCSGDARISPIPEDMASAIRDLNSQRLGKSGPALGAPNLNNVNALPLPGGGQYASGGPQPLPFPQPNSYSQPAPAPLPPVNSYAGAAIPQYGTSISGGNYAQPANQFMQYVAPNSYAAPPMNAYAQAPQQSWGAGPSCSASCAPAQPSCTPCAAGGGGAGSYFCFTADTLVETISGEKKRMDEMKIND
ncbi:hypothetical protein WR25_07245 [Diploscapter pachys]|uniref:WxxW domain-containing protein n=1 Tax=Diploscapter pachys TaxID=2018661 RepID=A0A2A2L895_9BILA|nr:hypothetical protein WR25_07245 [Diploscapter pachys]